MLSKASYNIKSRSKKALYTPYSITSLFSKFSKKFGRGTFGGVWDYDGGYSEAIWEVFRRFPEGV